MKHEYYYKNRSHYCKAKVRERVHSSLCASLQPKFSHCEKLPAKFSLFSLSVYEQNIFTFPSASTTIRIVTKLCVCTNLCYISVARLLRSPHTDTWMNEKRNHSLIKNNNFPLFWVVFNKPYQKFMKTVYFEQLNDEVARNAVW